LVLSHTGYHEWVMVPSGSRSILFLQPVTDTSVQISCEGK